MAVLVEAISVVIRRDAIERSYELGWQGFLKDVPNATFCADTELARVGFMHPEEVERFTDLLSSRGLVFLSDGECVDISVVDQQRGPTMPCHWLEFGQFGYGDNSGRISACWFFEGPRVENGLHMKSENLEVAMPAGWDYENSLSAQFTFISNDQTDERLRLLHTEDGLDVFLDTEKGHKVFMPSRRKCN